MLFRKRQNLGFTMVELLMTIALISILSTIATVSYIDYRDDARTAVTEQRMKEIKEALVGNPNLVAGGQHVMPGIVVDVGEVPTDLSSLTTQGSYPAYDLYEKRGWRGPYVDTNVSDWNKDAWGTTFSYDSATRTLKSCGSDTVCGGANAADDISLTF